MWSLLTKRFRWLDPYHPIAVREGRRNHPELPRFIRKLTDPWTMLGYAAMLHGIFFILSLIGYSRINRAFPNMMLPFLTPFGTPVAAGMLHSVLYWAMLIGICNYMTYFVTSEITSHMWPVLRTTPYTTREILVPLNHWAPLVSALVPSASTAEIVSRTVITVLFYFALPLLIGLVTFAASERRARKLY